MMERATRLRRSQNFDFGGQNNVIVSALPPAGAGCNTRNPDLSLSMRRTSCLSGFATPMRRSRSAKKALSKLKRLLTPTKTQMSPVLQAAAVDDHLARKSPPPYCNNGKFCEETSIWSEERSTCCSCCSDTLSSEGSTLTTKAFSPVLNCEKIVNATPDAATVKSLVDVSAIKQVSKSNIRSHVSTMETTKNYPASSTLLYPLHSTMAPISDIPSISPNLTNKQIQYSSSKELSYQRCQQQQQQQRNDFNAVNTRSLRSTTRLNNFNVAPNHRQTQLSTPFLQLESNQKHYQSNRFMSESTLLGKSRVSNNSSTTHNSRHAGLGKRPEPIGMSASDLQKLCHEKPVELKQQPLCDAPNNTVSRKRLTSQTSLRSVKKAKMINTENLENMPPREVCLFSDVDCLTPVVRKENNRQNQMTAKRLYRAHKQVLSLYPRS